MTNTDFVLNIRYRYLRNMVGCRNLFTNRKRGQRQINRFRSTAIWYRARMKTTDNVRKTTGTATSKSNVK
jgi:hypothetical protein